MKTININLSLEGIEIESDSKVKTGADLFINWVEQAVMSNYTQDDGKAIPMPEEQRRLAYRLLDSLEDHKDGIVYLNDKSYQFMQDRWKGKKFGAITINKQFRLIFKQIDKIILPDESNETPGEN